MPCLIEHQIHQNII